MTVYATLLGGATRDGRNADLAALLTWGLTRYRTVHVITPARVYATAKAPFGKHALALVSPRLVTRIVRVDRPLLERVTAPAVVSLPVAKGQRLGEVRVYAGRQLIGRMPLVASRRSRSPASRRAGWYGKRTLHHIGAGTLPTAGGGESGAMRRPQSPRYLFIPGLPHRWLAFARQRLGNARSSPIVTVTLNAAIDRTLTVPNFLLGQRHRASAGLTLAGGKGINVARALKRLGVPVVATGLAGGRTGTRIIEELTGEAILNDFVRIAGESRTSTAVVDPTSGSYTEINEWGPHVEPDELEMLLDKLRYLSSGADFVVLAGSLPRGVEPDFYAEVIRELTKRQVLTVLDAEGEPLRLGLEAEPFLVSPNQREAEALVGQEFYERQDFALALEHIAELGARNVLITNEGGCYARLREGRKTRRYRAVAPQIEVVSSVGSGDVLLAAFIAAQAEGRPLEDALRGAVAAGAASTQGGRRGPLRAERGDRARAERRGRRARARNR